MAAVVQFSQATVVVFVDDISVIIAKKRTNTPISDNLPELNGVNLAGAEFGLPPYPGTFGVDFLMPEVRVTQI